MAVKYAVANGNWSNPTIWNGGTIPLIGDDVYANGFTGIVIDQDINVNFISNELLTSPVISAGGRFLVYNGPRIIVGNVRSSSAGITALYLSSSSTVDIIGNIFGGSSASGYGVFNANSATVTITGNIYGGTFTVDSTGLMIIGGVNTIITGNIYGGVSAGIIVGSAGVYITVNGNVIGSSYQPGIYSGVSSIIVINGIAVAGDLYAAIQNSNVLGSLTVQALEYHINGNTPVNGYCKFKDNTSTAKVTLADLTQITLQDLSALPSAIPDESDVRAGVIYDAGDKTGTLIVPNKQYVLKGILVDSDIGEAILDPESFLTAINDSTNPIAERLRNVATVQTVASQLAAAL